MFQQQPHGATRNPQSGMPLRPVNQVLPPGVHRPGQLQGVYPPQAPPPVVPHPHPNLYQPGAQHHYSHQQQPQPPYAHPAYPQNSYHPSQELYRQPGFHQQIVPQQAIPQARFNQHTVPQYTVYQHAVPQYAAPQHPIPQVQYSVHQAPGAQAPVPGGNGAANQSHGLAQPSPVAPARNEDVEMTDAPPIIPEPVELPGSTPMFELPAPDHGIIDPAILPPAGDSSAPVSTGKCKMSGCENPTFSGNRTCNSCHFGEGVRRAYDERERVNQQTERPKSLVFKTEREYVVIEDSPSPPADRIKEEPIVIDLEDCSSPSADQVKEDQQEVSTIERSQSPPEEQSPYPEEPLLRQGGNDPNRDPEEDIHFDDDDELYTSMADVSDVQAAADRDQTEVKQEEDGDAMEGIIHGDDDDEYQMSSSSDLSDGEDEEEAPIARIRSDLLPLPAQSKQLTPKQIGKRKWDQRVRDGTINRPFKCDVENCIRSYAWQKGLYEHIESSHGKQFLIERKLKDNPPKPIACGINGCSSTATLKQNLYRHIRDHHGEEALVKWKREAETALEYVCYEGTCTESYTSRQNLLRHIQRNHGKYALEQRMLKDAQNPPPPKNFLCEFPGCGISYSAKNTRRRHITRDHRGENYLCRDCGFQASDGDGLVRHVQLFHDKGKVVPTPAGPVVSRSPSPRDDSPVLSGPTIPPYPRPRRVTPPPHVQETGRHEDEDEDEDSDVESSSQGSEDAWKPDREDGEYTQGQSSGGFAPLTLRLRTRGSANGRAEELWRLCTKCDAPTSNDSWCDKCTRGAAPTPKPTAARPVPTVLRSPDDDIVMEDAPDEDATDDEDWGAIGAPALRAASYSVTPQPFAPNVESLTGAQLQDGHQDEYPEWGGISREEDHQDQNNVTRATSRSGKLCPGSCKKLVVPGKDKCQQCIDGLCLGSCRKPVVPGKRKCAECLAVDSARQKARLDARKKKGLCSQCGGPVEPGQARCDSCCERERISRVARYDRARDNGTCLSCGDPVDFPRSQLYCSKHHERRLKNQRVKHAEKRARENGDDEWEGEAPAKKKKKTRRS